MEKKVCFQREVLKFRILYHGLKYCLKGRYIIKWFPLLATSSLALAGLAPSNELDGVNIVPYLTNEKKGEPH